MREIAVQFERIEQQFYSLKNSEAIGKDSIAEATRIIHVFDAEADIAEVFDKVRDRQRTRLLVRAAYHRCINEDTRHLWAYIESMPIVFQYEVKVAATEAQSERTATLAVRFSPVSLKSPERLANQEPFLLYAVYASEIAPPEDVLGVSWMLLTSEAVTSMAEAARILRWYTYRWHVEEYHKIINLDVKLKNIVLQPKVWKHCLGF